MSPSFNWTAVAIAIAAVFIFWTISSTSSPFTRSFPRLFNKRICLLIAHPDDEAMFFSPTVLALTKPELGNHLKILCLSTGDADGLGETRKKELQKSAILLGVRSESDVFIVDDPTRFPDSMTATWAPEHVTSLLASAFSPDLAATLNGTAKKNAKKAPTASIDVLLTFDERGISNHPNHRSLYHGAVHFLRTLMADKEGFACPVTLYTLTSTSIFRKYAGVLDAPLSMVQGVWSNIFAGKRQAGADGPSRLLFVSSVGEWLTAQSAMVMGHKSQMVWFRWGWITLGRYMTVNDLKQEKV
ncbi:N-acetylglucosaminyl-phosphatidylinositol de-N-acetylase [Penicillium macrosclerotiorum]|uniref:N-acetylglucosaminyl-phosphatidylinositol de-N-acetylase n=1 Tax=Penicillium macrosclerotiorum TaxID=303699 RepID=UPI002547CF15|nr:N-acetylglucosaminyl-phosphatidylinositol de-N-acetylase [Penicillium macrosclerotiorum]KAJ5690166.1 N-acetylglucosaminyl-phosphatidylinositol de-N-acetylase [Penicillium macrosclerotiorum]